MRYILYTFLLAFILIGCQNQGPTAMSLKKYHSFDKFDYSKEQIEFFEKEFGKIKEFENIQILKSYASFYRKNYSYFINGKLKAKVLEQKVKELKDKKVEDNLTKIKKAKKLINQNKKSDAINIYKELAEENNIKALRELVEIYKLNNPKLARKYFKKLVFHEDIGSMKEYASAHIYIIRPIETQNIKKAVEVYGKLVELGELSSMVRLGNIYEYGYHKNDFPKDLKKSLAYYEKAANEGYTLAKSKLLKIYSCEKCEGDRYNLAKATLLEQELNKIKITKKTPKRNSLKKKKSVISSHIREKIRKKSSFSIIPKSKKKEKPTFVIKCYDMGIATSKLSPQCKKDIRKYLKKYKKLSKIEIVPIVDKNDSEYFDKLSIKSSLKNSLLKSLANDRVLDVVWYLETKIKDSSIINIATYYAKSKKANKGVIIRGY